jgi:hypothetical protein
MCYRSWFRCVLTEINRLNGLKAQIRFSSKKTVDFFQCQFKNNDGLLANHIANLKDIMYTVSAIQYEF